MAPVTSLTAVADASMAEVAAHLFPHFARRETRERSIAYLRGLIAPVERKNGWQLAEAAGDRTPDCVQDFLRRSPWDPDAVRNDLQAYVSEHFGEPEGVLSVDETGFPKKGEKSAGVQRQYSGTMGRIDNCQIGVFLSYASSKGRAFLDRRLYLPESWCGDFRRRRAADIPERITFQTKPKMGLEMVEAALERGIPARWVTADTVYGNDSHFRRALEKRPISFVLAVLSSQRIGLSNAQSIAEEMPSSAWRRLDAGKGSKGPRRSDWAYYRFPMLTEGWEKGLVIRQGIGKERERQYYLIHAPVGTPLETLARVAGTRWTIECCFEEAKNDIGLDHYEVRSWTGWYRHITLAMFAHAYLAVVRQRMSGKKKRTRRSRRRFAAVDDSRSAAYDLPSCLGRIPSPSCRHWLVALA
jgi:SRSO17 transposase